VPRARLGVVLALPAPVATEIDGLRRAIGGGTPARVAPHITLVPPVNVSAAGFTAALDVVRDAAAASPPLRLVLGPPATFWPETPVVYLAVGGDDAAVRRLQAVVGIGPWHRPTTWPFVPHVTLAPDVDPALIPAAVTVLSGYRREVTVTEVHVLREEPDRSWVTLASVELSGRRVVARGGLEVVLERGAVLDPDAEERLVAAWASGVGRQDGHPFAIAARREGAVVGAATGASDADLWIDRIGVEPAARGQGVGRHLLRAVESLGAQRRCRRAFVVCASDAPARRWLENNGWRDDVDRRAGGGFTRMTRDLSGAP
jgi:2'-5' RNA ligase/GNAT superfamily N-acetyltransferase